MYPAGSLSLQSVAERELVLLQSPSGAYRAPIAAYPTQDLSSLARRLPQVRPQTKSAPLIPPVRLDLFTVANGRFAVGDGLDGLVLSDDGRTIAETAMFTRRTDRIDLPCPDAVLDDVFLGFDGGWTNWYHWLCFALGRSAIAARLLGPQTRIVLPDHACRAASWQQSLEAFGLAARVRLLQPGLYRARSIRLFWTTPSEPTNLTYLGAFHELFAQVRRGLRTNPDLPRRLQISRSRAANPRLQPAETALVEGVAQRHGFVPLHLEEFNFSAQAEAMFNAECVIGVHGAGMANILFGRRTLRVMELNLRLDGETLPRPWFYLLAHARGQRYMMLDRDAGDLSEERLSMAISVLYGD